MLQLQKFTFNAIAENTYVIFAPNRQAVVVDPGCYGKEEETALSGFVEAEGLTVTAVINTHCHIDHVLGNQYCKTRFNAPLLIPENEQATLAAVPLYSAMYGFPLYQPASPDGFLKAGGLLQVGEGTLKILYVPGHSEGHVAFYAEKEGFCVNGDVLFRGSIGRTDLPGGDFDTLMKSIRQTMFKLPGSTLVYCGHGPETTIAFEQKHNPFCGELAVG